MNRRTALMLSMLLGGLVPQSLWAQSGGRKVPKTRDKTSAPVSSRTDDPDDAGGRAEEQSGPFAPEPGFQWRRYPIARYTKAASSQSNPQKALIDWVFKRTGVAEWHGDKIAVLSANRSELRAYNSPEVLKQVDEVVERFTNAREDVLAIHVQFIAAVDTRWRYSVFSHLKFVASGPQGQQIWTMHAGRLHAGAGSDAASTRVPETGRPAHRDDQWPDPLHQDIRAADICQRPAARRDGGRIASAEGRQA